MSLPTLRSGDSNRQFLGKLDGSSDVWTFEKHVSSHFQQHSVGNGAPCLPYPQPDYYTLLLFIMVPRPHTILESQCVTARRTLRDCSCYAFHPLSCDHPKEMLTQFGYFCMFLSLKICHFRSACYNFYQV